MVPDLEALGIRMLLNECVAIDRGRASIYLAGVDDAHFYRADNIEKAAADIPHGTVSVLLSHTPEIYRQAAHAGFDLMLSGHTHGGQICLPGGIPILLEADLPRAFGAGAPVRPFFRTADAPGTIVIDTSQRFLYVVQPNNRALRYGIGVGRDGFQWSGLQKISRKQSFSEHHRGCSHHHGVAQWE